VTLRKLGFTLADTVGRTRRGSNASKRMARWIHDDLKLTDPLLEPDHSWRHRFKTECGIRVRVNGMSIPKVQDHQRLAIMGHAEASVSGVYGETPLTEALDAINSLRDPLDKSLDSDQVSEAAE
jgi:hypothetical protein